MSNPDNKKDNIQDIEQDIIQDYIQDNEKDSIPEINLEDNKPDSVQYSIPEINLEDNKPDSVQYSEKDSIPKFKPDGGKIDPNYQESDGKFKKGVSPNPGGRPKSEGFHKLLKKIFGEDSEELVYLLLAQMSGAQIDLDKTRIDEILPNHLKKYFKKAKSSDVDKKLQSDNVKWLIERMQGKLLSEVKSENTIKTEEDTKWKLEITHVDNKKSI